MGRSVVVTSGRIRWRGPAFPGDGNGQVRPGPGLPWETGGEGSRQALRSGTTLLVAYDIPSEGVRRRVADVCKDYGLVRMQLSVFVGELETRYHEEVRAKLA
ncbi:MAG: CRISPR-associated endonuclease Cas2 [Proteobacteria bacterium]|nr:CRISPR-associated endonuclease Cas2 [Pseudomonadota bacterium]